MAEEEEKEGEGGAEQEPPKKGKKKLIIIIVVVLLLVGGGAAAMLMGGGDAPAAEEADLEEEVHYETVELEAFIVNLNENASFLKIRLMLEYDPRVMDLAHGHGGGHGGGGYGGGAAGGGGDSGGLPGVFGSREPMIRDTIIRVLSSKRASDVLSVEGKEELKEELVEAINEATGLDEPLVVNIYFLEFIIQ